MKKKTVMISLGFGLFILGLLSLALNLVALNYSFLVWMDAFGPLVSFLIKLFMVFGGVVLVTLANDNESEYDEFFDGKEARKRKLKNK